MFLHKKGVSCVHNLLISQCFVSCFLATPPSYIKLLIAVFRQIFNLLPDILLRQLDAAYRDIQQGSQLLE